MGSDNRVRRFSAPGRVEIGGNHTDHQHGRVLAAAVGLEITATAIANGLDTVKTSGQFPCLIDIGQVDPQPAPEEKGTSAALIRGVAAWFAKNGYATGGFDADISSTIPVGSGLSSSAAFEVLIGNIFKGLFGADISPIELALAGQFAENVYFGKPCGLMDQAASSFGGLNVIDFSDPGNITVTPVVAEIPGYLMCVVDTGGSHADLTPDYAAIPNEMKAVARYFGKEYLSEVAADEFFQAIGALRSLGDRAVLRAIHFYKENDVVLKQADALERGDLDTFFGLVTESGRSSLAYLQNVFSPTSLQEQGVTLALALSEKLLAGKGAWRVHGGGFAGTILAFVPDEQRGEYDRQMRDVFGEGCCHFLRIRKEGGMETL
ncbi:MAG: galactokinase [Oscillospiraceae bacterium]|nr:galactokinase [Oscillospiraceae bacterium]